MDELGPGRRRAGQDRPVELAAADDLAGLADRRQAVAAGAHRVEVVEQAGRDGAGQRDRGAALPAEREDALADHGGTYSSVSSAACAIRARLIHGSNHARSTNFAPFS